MKELEPKKNTPTKKPEPTKQNPPAKKNPSIKSEASASSTPKSNATDKPEPPTTSNAEKLRTEDNTSDTLKNDDKKEKGESYQIIKTIIYDLLNGRVIKYKSAESYIQFYLTKDSDLKLICHIDFDKKIILLNTPSKSGQYTKRQINTIDDLNNYKNFFRAIAAE